METELWTVKKVIDGAFFPQPDFQVPEKKMG